MKCSLGVVSIKAFLSKDIKCDERLDILKKDLDLSFIPVLERRRLSQSSKIAFGLLKSVESMPIIFSSHKGEIHRCFAMMKDLAVHHITSPTAFSLSVLNSTPALLAIASKNHSEILAVSARDSLECGLINAYILLRDSINKVALVISYDESKESQSDKSRDISVVSAFVSLDTALPQIVLHKSLRQKSEIPSNIAFLKAFSQNSSQYQNGDFTLQIGDLLKGFSLADF